MDRFRDILGDGKGGLGEGKGGFQNGLGDRMGW